MPIALPRPRILLWRCALQKSQSQLFEMPVQVQGGVDKHGHYRKPHTRIMRVKPKEAHDARPQARAETGHRQQGLFGDAPQLAPSAAKATRLDKFMDRHGGAARLAALLDQMTAPQRERIVQEMARLGAKTVPEIAALLQAGWGQEAQQGMGDLFSSFEQKTTPAHASQAQAAIESVALHSPAPVPDKAGPDTNDGIEIKPGKGLALGKFFAVVDGESAPGGPWPDPQQAQEAGLGWRKRKAEYARAEADARSRKDALASRLKAGATPTPAELDMLGLRPGSSGAKWFFPAAADLFGISSRAVRPLVRDLIRVGHTDMGTRIEAVDPTKALMAMAQALAAPDFESVSGPGVQQAPEPFGVPAGITKAQRRTLNAQAGALVQRGGPYSEADKAVLRQYSGNGGVGDSLNEFYTRSDVAQAMWAVVQRLGVQSGTALEPSCGAGVYLHTAPAGFKVTGVELDGISAQIAQVLHSEKHEAHNASLERFATQDDRQFDAIIGNVPFGLRGALIKDDKPHWKTAEAYFCDTAMDKARGGGVVALIVPTGVMDGKNNRKLRETLMRKGQFLGAQRMPNTAFEHAHTEVTTDIVWLRKHPDDVAGALASSAIGHEHLKALGVWDEEFLSGGYFTGRGARNIHGRMEAGWRAKAGMGADITVVGSMEDVAASLGGFELDAVAAVPTLDGVLRQVAGDDAAHAKVLGAAMARPYENKAKVGDTKTVDGVTYVLQGRPPRWHRIDEVVASEALTRAQDLADRIDALVKNPQDPGRAALAREVQAWVDENGLPSKHKDVLLAAQANKTLYRLVGAVNGAGALSDALAGKVQQAVKGDFESTVQALLVGRDAVTADDIAQRLQISQEEALDHLYGSPRYAVDAASGRWTTRDIYLSGDLWAKLDAANAALDGQGLDESLRTKLQAQAQALNEAIAPDVLEDVFVQLNSAFVPTRVLSAFLTWQNRASEKANDWTRKLDPVQVRFAEGVYTIEGGNQYGTQKYLDQYLNRSGLRKDNKPAIDELNSDFKEWLCQSEYREEVEGLYNRKFRGYAEREFSNEPMDIAGMNTEGLKDFQYGGLRWALNAGKGIIAHDVGLGKTVLALMLARTMKATGQAQRPMVVVPKSVLANWYAECEKWFPGSKVLTIGGTFSRDADGTLRGKDDSAAERKRKYHDLQQNEYDFIVISEPSFEELDLDPATKGKYHADDFWVQRGDKLGNTGDKRTKQIRESWEQQRAGQEFSEASRTDATYFNQLGVDAIIHDEFHHQKNLVSVRSRFGEQPKFLGGGGLSMRALDFNLKARWLLDQQGGKNVYGLTATPTKNSPIEIYAMLSHVAPEALHNMGIRNSEEFLDRYARFEEGMALTTGGKMQEALITAGFQNMDELRALMRRYMRRKTAADVGLKLPERQDVTHMIDMDNQQQAKYAELRALADQSGGKDATGDAHIFSIMDKMNKAATDMSLLDASYDAAKSPKYVACAQEIIKGLRDGGQIVFSDYVESHEKIAESLVRAGIPRKHIGILNAKAAASASARQRISDDFNSGKLKVVIGNTAVMGEGINLQKNTSDIHHLDLPWEPASIQQRNGRGLRQGNTQNGVRIHNYLARSSFDGYRLQSIMAKKDWQDAVWNGDDEVENLNRQDVGRDELMVMLAADPDQARAAYAANTQAQQEKLVAQKTAQAAGKFLKFQESRRSYNALQNKNTATAQRLKTKLDSERAALQADRYFKAKQALDMDGDVLVTDAGALVHVGAGIEMQDKGRFVVTAVDARTGAVSIRAYAQVSAAAQSHDMAQLKGATAFAYEQGQETQEMARQIAEKPLDLSKLSDLYRVPGAAFEVPGAAQKVQNELWDRQKAYTLAGLAGNVPLVDKRTGQVVAAPYYDLGDGKEFNRDTHDFVLPTDDNRRKVIEAWVQAERGATLGIDVASTSNRRRSSAPEAVVRKYGVTERTNPLQSVLHEIHGENPYHYGAVPSTSVLGQARAQLAQEQAQRIHDAASMQDAFHAALPLASVSAGTATSTMRHKATLPRAAVEGLWRKAQSLSALHTEASSHRHPKDGYGGAWVTHNTTTVQATLVDLALRGGHTDLALSMVRDAPGGIQPQTLAVLANACAYGGNAQVWRALQEAATQMGVLDKTRSEMQNSPSMRGMVGYSNGMQKIGDWINEGLENALLREERMAA